MLASPALHLVDEGTGEVIPGCPHCLELKDELAGIARDLRGWRARYAALKRDREAEAKESPYWPEALKLFGFWRSTTNHKRSQWTPERFELVQPFLKRHGPELCEKAIRGHAYDPFTIKRKNGSIRRFDSWELLFRDEAHFEEAANKCPLAEHT